MGFCKKMFIASLCFDGSESCRYRYCNVTDIALHNNRHNILCICLKKHSTNKRIRFISIRSEGMCVRVLQCNATCGSFSLLFALFYRLYARILRFIRSMLLPLQYKMQCVTLLATTWVKSKIVIILFCPCIWISTVRFSTFLLIVHFIIWLLFVI